MYCINCGAELRDDAQFCDKCGNPVNNTQNENRIEEKSVSVLSNDDNKYNRDIILMHLYDLRALEIEKERLRKNIEDLDRSNDRLAIPRQIDPPVKRSIAGIVIAVFFLVFFIVLSVVCISLYNSQIGSDWFDINIRKNLIPLAVFLMFFAFVSFICLIATILNYRNYQKQYGEYLEKKHLDKKRCAYEETLKEKRETIRSNTYKEYKEVESLLEKSYASNIVPGPFRNLYAVYYLYDYLSTSSQSISEALLHVDLEAIKNKLDYSISQNTDIILQQAQMNANLAQNKELMENAIQIAEQIEQNTARSAQYAQISVAHEAFQLQIARAAYWKLNKDL